MEFCAKCGKTGKTIEGLCRRCYKQTKELNIKDIKVKICIDTDRYLYRNKWYSFTDKSELLEKLAREQLKEPCTIAVNIPPHTPKPNTKVTAQLTIAIHGNEYIIPATINYTVSAKEKKHSGYFEAILQIRNPISEVYDAIEEAIARRGNVFIANAIDTKHGRDYYLSSNQFAQSLGKTLQKTYGGELKITSKLHSRDKLTSKKLYRLTVLLRLPKAKLGDIIILHGERYRVMGFDNKVKIQNLTSGKKSYCNYNEL